MISGIIGGMGAGMLGTLVVKLSADSVALVKGMGAAEKSILASSAKMAGAVAGLTAAVAGAAAVIGYKFVKASVDAADAMGKTAQRAGQAVEAFSGLAYAANLADVSQQELANTSIFLSRWMDRSGKSSSDLTEEIIRQADTFAQMEDGSAKLLLAYERFGRSGAQLLPLLNQGTKAIRDQMEEARRFGAVISDEFSNNAQTFNDNLTRIGTMFRGIFNLVAERLLPVWIEMQERFIQWAKDTDAVRIAADAIIAGFETLYDIIDGTRLAVATLTASFKTFATIIATSVTVQIEVVKNTFKSLIELFGVFWGVMKDPTTIVSGIEQANKIISDSAERTKDIIVGSTTEAVDEIKDTWSEWSATATRILEPVKVGTRAVADSVKQATIDIEESSNRISEALTAMGAPKNRLESMGLNEKMARDMGLSSDTMSQLSGFSGLRPSGIMEADALGALKNEEQILRDRLMVLEEIGQQEIALTEEVEKKKLEAIEAYNDRLRQLQMAQAQTILGTGSKMFEDMATMAEAFGGKQSAVYKAMFAASKAFAVAEATVKILQGVAAAAALPWPANLGAMASVVAATASIVSNIQAVKLEFGGERAEGGPVSPNKAFLVGERGPEMFVPKSRGTIIPNDEMGSGKTRVVINNYTDARPEVTERTEGNEKVIEVMIRRVKNEISSEIRDGRGGVNRAMEETFSLRRGR